MSDSPEKAVLKELLPKLKIKALEADLKLHNSYERFINNLHKILELGFKTPAGTSVRANNV